MKKYSIVFILFSLLVLQSASCTDPIIPDDPNIPGGSKTKLKFVWIKPIYQDSSSIFQSELYFSGDYVAVGTLGYLPENKDKGMALFHRMNGSKHPSWNFNPCCILEGNEIEIQDFAIGGAQNDVALLSDLSNLYAYNVHNGQKKWRALIPVYMPSDKFTTFGNQVYLPYWEGTTWSNTWAKLARYDIQTGSKEDLFTVNVVPGYDFLICPPVGVVAPNNDTLVIGVTQHYRFTDHAKMAWLYCYNVTQKTMKWENRSFASDNEDGRNDPQIMNNGKALIQTIRGVYCIDIETGALVWSKEGLCLSLNKTHLLYDDNKVFCRLDDGKIHCWDADTGTEIWRNNSTLEPIEKCNMVLYNGKLYFNSYWAGNGVMTCLNAQTGELLWRDPGINGSMAGLLLLDKNLGYLYGYSCGLIYCIDLNRTELFMPSN